MVLWQKRLFSQFNTHTVIQLVLGFTIIAAALVVLASFWPGSIGWDYDIVLKEAALGSFRGHQPAPAGMFAWAVTFGTSYPAPVFVLKVVVFFAGAAVVVFSRAPLIVRIGATLLVLSPAVLYHAPLLRTNTIEAAFLGLAFAIGMTGHSKTRAAIAWLCLVCAALHSQALNPGHAGLVMLYFMWNFPGWSLLRNFLSAVAVVISVWGVLAAANAVAGNPSRSSTLYVSTLNGVAALHKTGETTCLSPELVRGGAKTPEDVLDEYYAHPHIGTLLWRKGEGLRPPLFLSEQQHTAVMDCWKLTVAEKPGAFIRERVRLALMTLRASHIDQQFVFLREGPWLLQNKGYAATLDLPAVSRAILSYGHWGSRIKLTKMYPYLALLLLVGAVVFALRKEHRLFVVVAILTVIGFMLPQLLLAQALSFRYYLVSASVTCWIGLAFLWVLSDRSRRTLQN